MTGPVDISDLADDRETLRLAKAEMAKWKDVADAAAAKIQERLGDAEVAVIDGRPVATWKRREVTRVDVKTLRADVPAEVLAPYLKTTTERRFELCD